MDEDDESRNGEPDEDKLSKIAQGASLIVSEAITTGQPKTSGERDASATFERPTDLASQTLFGSPSARLASELFTSPSQQLAKQLASGLSPSLASVPNLAYLESMRYTYDPISGLAAKIASLHSGLPTIDNSVFNRLHAVQPFQAELVLSRTMRDLRDGIEKTMHPFAAIPSALKDFQARQGEAATLYAASLAGPLGELSRTGQWASAIAKLNSRDIPKLFGEDLGGTVEIMRDAIAKSLNGTIVTDQAKMSSMLGLNTWLDTDFTTTRLKMSALAGIGEAFGPSSEIRLHAYHALFGAWRSSPNLPYSFWRDKNTRKRMYRDAEVDDGLIEATPGVALDIMVESGLAAGTRSEKETLAVVVIGEVSMTVRSRGARKDAFATLDRFERELRAYVSRKLEDRFGPDWFKIRASNLLGKAKGIRKAAMERGEAFAPLIHFVELGELAGIILSKGNWDELFGDVFINRAEFDYDMQKLVATRRPTMHIRPIDGVRLVEMFCVMQRLGERMVDDGAWKAAADSDR